MLIQAQVTGFASDKRVKRPLYGYSKDGSRYTRDPMPKTLALVAGNRVKVPCVELSVAWAVPASHGR